MFKNNPDGPSGSTYNYNHNYNRELSPYELKTVREIDVWYEYIRLKQLPGVNVALQELLKRHDNILHIIARKYQQKFSLTSDLEDKVQHARYAAMRAYDRFDITKAKESKVRLSSYIGNCAAKYLQSANDTDSFIDCPPARRIVRSYLWGRYDSDPVKKIEIEKRLGVKSHEDKEHLFEKFSTLLPIYISIDAPSPFNHNLNLLSYGDILVDETAEQSLDISVRIHLQNHMKKLSSRQVAVLNLFSEGLKMSEIAEELNISENAVRGDLRTIRIIMKRFFNADNKEESALMQNM